MTTLGALYQSVRKTLREGGVDTPDLDARLLISHALNRPAQDVLLHPDASAPDASQVHDYVTRRLNGAPVSKIIGSREFYGLDFIVTDDVLDPRADSETLINAVRTQLQNRAGDALEFLDICTGSGCLAITLLTLFKNARAMATDISPAALEIARKNAQKHGVQNRITFLETSYISGVQGAFDAVICNPPYIRTADIAALQNTVRDHDPMLALDGGMDGLTPYRKIFPQIRGVLKNDARAVFEMGFDQADDLRLMAALCGLTVHDVLRDLGGNDRAMIIS